LNIEKFNSKTYEGPAAKYSHDGDDPKNVNIEFKEQLTIGQKTADMVAKIVGSWKFILVQSAFFIFWMIINIMLAANYFINSESWDPYPFILLNLMLSFEAAYTGPIIMMSQNRQAAKDRLMAESDFEVNQKAETEIKVIMEHLVSQDKLLFLQNKLFAEKIDLVLKTISDKKEEKDGTTTNTTDSKKES
jgi:uncharacterized membrane protein